MIKRIPKPRRIHTTRCSYVKKGVRHTIFHRKIPMKEIRQRLTRPLPPIKRDKLQVWVDNIWEALYNPVWLIRRGKRLDVKDGWHRLRILNALKIEYVLCVLCTPGVKTVDIPACFKVVNKKNLHPPRYGRVLGVCSGCGKRVRYKRLVKGGRLRIYCPECGVEVPYPYP